MDIDLKQAVDLRPTDFQMALESGSRAVVMALVFENAIVAHHAYNLLVKLRRGKGLRLDILPEGKDEPFFIGRLQQKEPNDDTTGKPDGGAAANRQDT